MQYWSETYNEMNTCRNEMVWYGIGTNETEWYSERYSIVLLPFKFCCE